MTESRLAQPSRRILRLNLAIILLKIALAGLGVGGATRSLLFYFILFLKSCTLDHSISPPLPPPPPVQVNNYEYELF